MSARATTRLAWSLWALAVALTALGLLLLVPNYTAHVYDYWLENTLGAVLYSTVGALVASRRPDNAVGWLFCLQGLAYSIGHFSSQYAIYSLLAQPGSLPGGQVSAWVASWILPPLIGLQVFSFLLFPTGCLPSRRWRPFAWLTVAFVVAGVISSSFSLGANAGLGPVQNPLGVEGFFDVYSFVLNMLPLLYVAVAYSLFARLRRAGEIERQQIKWFAFAVVATVGGTVVAYMIPDTFDTPPWFDWFGYALVVATTPAIPVSIGIAILRYRLYDIDLIINRTLVYGPLTATLLALYFGLVTATQALFQTLTGQQRLPQLAIVASTLAIAALFNPLRRRVQDLVDRRFYRKKYDAAKTLEEFGAALRDTSDLDGLKAKVTGVIRETVQPAHVSFWLAPVRGKDADD